MKTRLFLSFFLCLVLMAMPSQLIYGQKAGGHVKMEKCSVCGKFKQNCEFRGKHPKCKICGKVKMRCPCKGNPQKPALSVGTLSISSTPSDAVVKIDGEYMGTTPLTLKNRKAGTYKVTFSAEGYETQMQTVTVTAGKTATCSATLKKTSQPDENESIKKAYDLGEDYYYGRNGKKKNYSEAVKWYRQAADQGYAAAQVNLGEMYIDGYGVPKDYVEAVRWFRKAANQGNAKGQCGLGTMYAVGAGGLTQNYEEAIKWLRKAANQNYAEAQYCLGVMHEDGKGVPQDITEAIRWYRKAADQGDTDAKTALERLNGAKTSGSTSDTRSAYGGLYFSYSSKDAEIAKQAKSMLSRAGYKCWMATDEIVSGDNMADMIDTVIKNSKCLLFFGSKHSCQSKWAEHELILATQAGLKIIPIKLDDTPYSEYSDRINFVTEDIYWLVSDLKNQEELEKLKKAVKGILGY